MCLCSTDETLPKQADPIPEHSEENGVPGFPHHRGALPVHPHRVHAHQSGFRVGLRLHQRRLSLQKQNDHLQNNVGAHRHLRRNLLYRRNSCQLVSFRSHRVLLSPGPALYRCSGYDS